jgi:hypothetical protein
VLVGALFRMNHWLKIMNEVYRTVPFVYLFILGTQAVLSVIGVRTVPHMYICGNRYTITLGTGTPNE